jgi:hypothetical protein
LGFRLVVVFLDGMDKALVMGCLSSIPSAGPFGRSGYSYSMGQLSDFRVLRHGPKRKGIELSSRLLHDMTPGFRCLTFYCYSDNIHFFHYLAKLSLVSCYSTYIFVIIWLNCLL